MRNALAHVSKDQHTVVAAAIRQAFDQPDRKHAGETWRHVAEQLRARWPRLADLMDASEHDVLASMAFPRQHRTKLHSTNPIARLNKKARRRADVALPEQAFDPVPDRGRAVRAERRVWTASFLQGICSTTT